MRIGGYQKLTLIDYPGKIATTVFTVGCSFRCPFCHNPELVLRSHFPAPNNMEKDFFEFLQRRKGKLEGVCITGGEPIIQPDIIDFIKKIKSMGFFVKLDSNGSRPDVLKKIIDQKLVDFIAMDIKNSIKKYPQTVGVKNLDVDRVKLSVKLIMNSGLPYEFRTTVVPGIHEKKDFISIAKWIKGAKAYYLQEYRDKITLNRNIAKITNKKEINLNEIKSLIKPYFAKIGIRKNN